MGLVYLQLSVPPRRSVHAPGERAEMYVLHSPDERDTDLYMIYIVAQKQHSTISELYTHLSVYTVVLWILYPIIFALSEGADRISNNAETIAYCIIDVLAKTVFGFWLLLMHKHDSEDEHSIVLPESWTEPRGTREGVIQLPVGNGVSHDAE